MTGFKKEARILVHTSAEGLECFLIARGSLGIEHAIFLEAGDSPEQAVRRVAGESVFKEVRFVLASTRALRAWEELAKVDLTFSVISGPVEPWLEDLRDMCELVCREARKALNTFRESFLALPSDPQHSS